MLQGSFGTRPGATTLRGTRQCSSSIRRPPGFWDLLPLQYENIGTSWLMNRCNLWLPQNILTSCVKNTLPPMRRPIPFHLQDVVCVNAAFQFQWLLMLSTSSHTDPIQPRSVRWRLSILRMSNGHHGLDLRGSNAHYREAW